MATMQASTPEQPPAVPASGSSQLSTTLAPGNNGTSSHDNHKTEAANPLTVPVTAATATSIPTSSSTTATASLAAKTGAGPEAENVRVAVRIRPQTNAEFEAGSRVVAHKTPAMPHLQLSDRHQFTFDDVFGSEIGQSQIFEDCVQPLVDSSLEGRNATILAYGQVCEAPGSQITCVSEDCLFFFFLTHPCSTSILFKSPLSSDRLGKNLYNGHGV